MAHDHGLYVVLRIGPYVCAEWNLGGLPTWLLQKPGMVFRTWNEPFMTQMEKFVRKTVQVVKPFMATYVLERVFKLVEPEAQSLQCKWKMNMEMLNMIMEVKGIAILYGLLIWQIAWIRAFLGSCVSKIASQPSFWHVMAFTVTTGSNHIGGNTQLRRPCSLNCGLVGFNTGKRLD